MSTCYEAELSKQGSHISHSVNRSQGSPLEIPRLLVEAVVTQNFGIKRQAGSSVTTLSSFKTHLSLIQFKPFLKGHRVLLSTGKSFGGLSRNAKNVSQK